MSIVTVDRYGRIRIPKALLEELNAKLFLVQRVDRGILLIPIRGKKLSELIDSIEIDIPPEAFEDYHELKKSLVKSIE